jgi:hypothetical protein
VKHLSFFNLFFSSSLEEEFAARIRRVKGVREKQRREKVSCYHFSKACFMASVFLRNFLQFKVFYSIYTRCLGGERAMEGKLNADASETDGFKIEQVLH